jgi:fucose permease
MQRVYVWTAICFIAFVATGVSLNLLGATLGNLSAKFEIPLSDAGIFTALQAIAATFSVAVFGWLLDRHEPRWVLCGATLIFGSGVLLLGFAPTLPLALFGVSLLGIGFGGMLTGPNYVIAALYSNRAASALNALNVFFSAGAIASAQVVALALRQGNFSLAYGAAGVLMLALVVPFSTMRIPQGKKQEHQDAPVQVNYLSLIPFILLFFTYIGSEIGFGSWIFTQLSTAARATAETAALATSLFWAGNMFGRIAGTFILRRMADEVLLPLTVMIMIIGVSLLLAFQRDANISTLAAFIMGFGCGPVFPTMLGIVRKTYPTTYGTASGILLSLGNTGAIVMPWVQGQVGGGNSGGMQVTLVLSLITLVTAVVILRRVGSSDKVKVTS